MARAWPLALTLALVLVAPLADARDVCMVHESGHGVPIRTPQTTADLGVLPEVCPQTRLSLEGRGSALIATGDFYGNLLAGAALRGTLALPNGHWLSLWVPGIEHRFVANATIEASRTSLGAGALGWHVPVRLGERVTVTPFARVLWPTETVFVRARRYGFDQGVSALYALTPRLEAVAGLSFASTFTAAGSTTLVWTPTLGGDLVFRPWHVLSIAGGVAIRPLDSFDPRVGLRLHVGSGATVALSAAAPLLGRDRTDLALGLSIGWEWLRDGVTPVATSPAPGR